MATAKIQTQGFKTAIHKPMGDLTDSASINYIVFTADKENYRKVITECKGDFVIINNIKKNKVRIHSFGPDETM